MELIIKLSSDFRPRVTKVNYKAKVFIVKVRDKIVSPLLFESGSVYSPTILKKLCYRSYEQSP